MIRRRGLRSRPLPCPQREGGFRRSGQMTGMAEREGPTRAAPRAVRLRCGCSAMVAPRPNSFDDESLSGFSQS